MCLFGQPKMVLGPKRAEFEADRADRLHSCVESLRARSLNADVP